MQSQDGGSWGHLGSRMGVLEASWPQVRGSWGFWAACWGVFGNMLDRYLASYCILVDIPKIFRFHLFFNGFRGVGGPR